MVKSNENNLGIYKIGYDLDDRTWTAYILAYGPENAQNFIAAYVGKRIRINERSFICPMHHITVRAQRMMQKVIDVENPNINKKKEASAADLWRCPYCEWTGKTQNALKSHITREHKD